MLDLDLLTRHEMRMLKHAASNAGRYVAGMSERPGWDGFVRHGLAVSPGPRPERGLTVFELTDDGFDAARKLARGVRP